MLENQLSAFERRAATTSDIAFATIAEEQRARAEKTERLRTLRLARDTEKSAPGKVARPGRQ